jgi:hypothetical protein
VSIEALRIPVVIRSFRSGGDDDLKSLQRRDDLVRAAEMLVENLELNVALDPGPIGGFEGYILIIVEDCAANRHVSHPMHAHGYVLAVS